MRLHELSERLWDITHYLGIPQWQVADEYNVYKISLMKIMPNETQTYYQRRALSTVYERYEKELLEIYGGIKNGL